MNYSIGQTIANEVITELSLDGEMCVYSSNSTDLIIDIVGTIGLPTSS